MTIKHILPMQKLLKLEKKKKERRLHVDNRGVNLIMKEVSVSCQMINKVNEKPFFLVMEKRNHSMGRLKGPVSRRRAIHGRRSLCRTVLFPVPSARHYIPARKLKFNFWVSQE